MSATTSFHAVADELRALATLLSAAEDSRYEAPPGRSIGGKDYRGVSNPTLDTVLHPLRMSLSDSVRDVDHTLQIMHAQLAKSTRNLDRTLSAWQGWKLEDSEL